MAIGTTAAILGGATLLSGAMGAGAAKKAAKTQAAAADRAAELQFKQFEQTREDLKPWREAGSKTLADLVGRLPELTAAPDATKFKADPAYEFRLSESLRGVENSAAARGVLGSGGTLAGIAERAGNLADQTYGDWWNRERAVQGDTFNRLASIAGVGQTATTDTGRFGAAAASNAGEAITQGANARASGYIGQANAMGGTLSNLIGIYGMTGGFGGGMAAPAAYGIAGSGGIY